MGSDALEVHESPLHPSCIKVHVDMCTRLIRLVDRISSIFHDIEAARPCCSDGLLALCQLRKEIQNAKTLVQKCCDSSKLYMAITGQTVVSRFERTRKSMQQSLSQLQSMVPVVLGFKMSGILDDLRDTFVVDANELEAGKALQSLLHQDTTKTSVGTSVVEVLQFVAMRLHLSSKKDILIEKRSIRKLFNEVDEGNSKKKLTLRYLSYLLKKYDEQILHGSMKNPPVQDDASYLFLKSDNKSVTTNSISLQYGAQPKLLQSSSPPEEFICPLSSQLMYDPVIISSGQTFERTFIQKWFDEGYDTCPRTELKLTNFSMIPNASMKDLIAKWSMEHGVIGSDPSIQTSTFGSFDTSSNSVCSTASSMRDIHVEIDISNLSLGSLDSSYSSGFIHTKVERGYSSLRKPPHAESHKFQFFETQEKMMRHFLSNVSGLPWKSQCKAVDDVKHYLTHCNPSFTSLSSENFLEPLVQFLKDALDCHDPEAQKAGIQLLLTFLKADRMEVTPIPEDLYALLASFLGTEAVAGVLVIMEVLSSQKGAFSNFTASGALTSIIEFLGDHNKEFNQAVIRVLSNLSSSIDINSCDLAAEWVPILVPFMKDGVVVGSCLSILENLCKFEAGRVSIAETAGCIGSITELLETGNCEDQALAVDILLSLCTQREHYCHLVLYEGVIPYLTCVSNNGNERGKVGALELLRVLRDVKYEDKEEPPGSDADASLSRTNLEEQSSARTSLSIGKRMMKFFKWN